MLTLCPPGMLHEKSHLKCPIGQTLAKSNEKWTSTNLRTNKFSITHRCSCRIPNSVSSPDPLRLFKLSHAMSSSFCLKLVSFFRAALVSCSSFVSLRAVYRDCLVRVASLFRPVTLGFASGEADTAITASPMLRVSKRLPLTYFASQKLRQGPAQLVAPTPKQAASDSGEITSSTITATSPETSAPTAFTAPAMTAATDLNSERPKDQSMTVCSSCSPTG